MVKTTKKRSKTKAPAENVNRNENTTALKHIQGPMVVILTSAQTNATHHKRCVKEMQQLYAKMDHDDFVLVFIQMLKTVLAADETNENGANALIFCSKFLTSFKSERTHPMLAATFQWLLNRKSHNTQIRYRICYFVNLILKELGPYAALDDVQCDQILNYMVDRLVDLSSSVRKQAVLAMQRLQMPDKPDDPVLLAYQFHLSSDPSSTVRQCVITCMGRNYHTVPYILNRLWDIDEKMRRHTYLNMCNYPVRSYTVSQRLTLLEQGLNDTSEGVRKAVIKYMLKQWIESYQRNFIALLSALKLDSTEEELQRFKRIVRQLLMVIFEENDNTELLSHLPLSEDCELHRCVPQESLTLELVLYWQYLSEYLQQTQADEFELVLPELSVFCAYVEKFIQFQKPDMDKFAQLEFQYLLLSLVEILHDYDLGDEIGRNKLKELITLLMKDCLLDHKIVQILVRCTEQLISDVAARMQYFLEIIYEICELNAKQNDLVHDRNLINKLLDDLDPSLKMKISSLKVKILDLEEQEGNFVRQKEYIRAQTVTDEKNAVTEDYTELIRPLLEKHGVVEFSAIPKLSKKERILKGLYITFYMVASKDVKSLNPSISKLYKDFICRNMASTETEIFDWAIKCGSSFSMLYDAYSKEMFEVLIDQFYKENNLRLWETSTVCLFELIDHYGVDYFIDDNQTLQPQSGVKLVANKNKMRQLYTIQDFFDGDGDGSQSQNSEQNTDIIGMMGHFVEKVVDKGIGLAIVKGLCRLVLRGQLNHRTDVLEKLLKRYFNPNTEPHISQVLGKFFEDMMALNKQSLLEPCLLPTVWNIMNCNFDSPLHDIVPDNVTKFFIDMTRQKSSTSNNTIHNKIALSFLQYIHNYFTERKEMCRLLAKDLTTLTIKVADAPQIKEEMIELADKLINSELEPRMVRNITNFKDMLDGVFNPPLRRPDGNETDDECDSATVVTSSECTQPEVNAVIEVAAEMSKQAEEPAQPSATEHEVIESTTATTADSEKNENEATKTETLLTTFGHENQVGIRFLRRSLANSVSHSDAESFCSEPTRKSKSAEPEEPPHKKQQQEKVRQISKRNLERPKTRQRLEQAVARASKTPEKESSESIASNVEDKLVDEDNQNTSEVIPASPTSESPIISSNISRLRKRTTRANNTSNLQPVASKRKVLLLDTPLRNGKRVLRKSPPRLPQFASPSRSSPLRKQRRLNEPEVLQQSPKPVNKTVSSRKSTTTASPTESQSSIKENEAPKLPPVLSLTASTPNISKPSKSKHNSQNVISVSSVPTPIITRNSARKLRLNTMCMTRKRMSLELNTSDGQHKPPTPKRALPVKGAKSASKAIIRSEASDSNEHTRSSSADRKTARTRATAIAAMGWGTPRPRRK